MMKKILAILFLFLMFCTKNYASDAGEGDLKLTESTIKHFQEYIKGTKGVPEAFAVSIDGSFSHYWSCNSWSNNCSGSNNIKSWIKKCSEKAYMQCKIFAKRRTIKWKNGINPGKGKASKINSKLSDSDIEARLTELGFYGGSSSTNTESSSVTVSSTESTETDNFSATESSTDIVSKIKAIHKLYKDGIITKEEFEKEKAKILN